MTQLIPEPPWPRSWYNYPILLCGIALQYIWAFAILFDKRVMDITAISPLIPYIHESVPYAHPDPFRWFIIILLLMTASSSVSGFFMQKKIHTLFALIPQQFVMIVSSIGAIHAMTIGRFADGVERPIAFLTADQSPIVLLTIFHTWAMILILIHAGDNGTVAD